MEVAGELPHKRKIGINVIDSPQMGEYSRKTTQLTQMTQGPEGEIPPAEKLL
jgi:hypothetical protein